MQAGGRLKERKRERESTVGNTLPSRFTVGRGAGKEEKEKSVPLGPSLAVGPKVKLDQVSILFFRLIMGGGGDGGLL